MNRNTTATILLVLAVGIYFTVTEKVLNDAKAVKVVNDQYTSAITNAEKLISVRDKVRNDYTNISDSDKQRIDKMMPSTVDNIRLIIDLNSVALKHGLTLKGIKAAASQSKTGTAPAPVPAVMSANGQTGIAAGVIPVSTLDSVTVSFGVTATYQQFEQFLQDIEANLRVMDVTHLSVTATDSGLYDYSVELKTYWLRSQ